MSTKLWTQVLTTGQVAKILHVAPRTASKLIDNGKINGWKMGNDRRVMLIEVLKYMRDNSVPFDLLKEAGVPDALVASAAQKADIVIEK